MGRHLQTCREWETKEFGDGYTFETSRQVKLETEQHFEIGRYW